MEGWMMGTIRITIVIREGILEGLEEEVEILEEQEGILEKTEGILEEIEGVLEEIEGVSEEEGILEEIEAEANRIETISITTINIIPIKNHSLRRTITGMILYKKRNNFILLKTNLKI